MQTVTDVIVGRSASMRGLPRMVTISAVAHAALGVAMVVWAATHPPDRVEDLTPVMTISLGGAAGPQAGGMTMAGRPFQATAPLPEVARPEPLRPVASKAPAMVLPDPKAKPAKKPTKPPVETAEPGAQVVPPKSVKGAGFGDSAVAAENPNKGMGFGGLSTGGGGGTGGYLDVQNFCCPDYLVTMLQVVQKNWNAKQQVGGEALIKFRIQRDGRVTDIELERSSGYAALDITAQRALFMTQRLPALPAAFPENQLTVHLRFQYQR
jgi:TonB family protein